MEVMMTARQIGLIAEDGSNVFGTIERDAVLAVLSDLAVLHPADADLFVNAADRVLAARSAGVERLDSTSFLGRTNLAGEIQLTYRSDMADVFMDLAIDLGIRQSATRSPATTP
jgi:hypothetical protein